MVFRCAAPSCGKQFAVMLIERAVHLVQSPADETTVTLLQLSFPIKRTESGK